MDNELGRNDNEDLKLVKSLIKEGKLKDFEWVLLILN